jgi:hypothetical protein
MMGEDQPGGGGGCLGLSNYHVVWIVENHAHINNIFEQRAPPQSYVALRAAIRI